jgi:hypothetical protein
VADNVTFQAATPATPPSATVAATRERSDGSHAAVTVATARSATVANVNQSATVVTLLNSNDDRAGFVIENDAEGLTAALYVKFGSAASLTDYTRKILPGQAWERLGGYSGIITGIWDAAGTGKARVTEEVL